MEKGSPSVAMGSYVTVLWVIGMTEDLVQMEHPDRDIHGKVAEHEAPTTRARATHLGGALAHLLGHDKAGKYQLPDVIASTSANREIWLTAPDVGRPQPLAHGRGSPVRDRLDGVGPVFSQVVGLAVQQVLVALEALRRLQELHVGRACST